MKVIRLGLAVPSDSGGPGYTGQGDSLRDDTLEGSQLAEAVNNAMQDMWRATRQAGLGLDNPLVHRINAAIAQWEPWWAGFNDALLERQFDFGLGLWGTDWGDQLKGWQADTIALDDELKRMLARQVQTGEASPDQAQAYEQGLSDRGVDDTLSTFQDNVDRQSKPPMFLFALGAVGMLIGVGIYLGRKR